MVDGNTLVDTPLAKCKLSLSSEQVVRLEVPAQLYDALSIGVEVASTELGNRIFIRTDRRRGDRRRRRGRG